MEKTVVFAKNLEQQLLSKNMKQKELALMVDYTPQMISDYLKYGRTNSAEGKKPSLESVLKIAKALDVSLDELFEMRPKTDGAKRKLNTVGEAINELLWLFNELPICYTPETETVFSSLNISIAHDALNAFFLKYDKMWRLWTVENVIDEDLFNTWLNAEIEKMNSVDLLSSARPASPFDDLCDDDYEANWRFREAQNGIDET